MIKIPLYRLNQSEFTERNFKGLLPGKQENNWYLIENRDFCKNNLKTCNLSNITEDDLIYFYKNSFHQTQSKYPIRRNSYVICDILKERVPPSKRKEYKELILFVVNILHFARIDWIAFPKESLNDLKSFEKFIKETFD